MRGCVVSEFMGVQVYQLREMWPVARGYILQAVERSAGEYDEASLYEALTNRSMQLWLLWEKEGGLLGAAITQVVNFPTRKVAEVVLAGGRDIHLWADQLEVVEAWARSVGADELRFLGRVGLDKVVREQGYVRAYTVFSKTLGVVH